MRYLLGLLISATAFGGYPAYCEYDNECLIDVPESQCADGTQSFITVTKRHNAKNVLIYLKGGGACWDGKSCDNGLARPLTRLENGTEWNTGNGIHSNDSDRNPFANDYDLISIPYCTGDAFIGDAVNSYTHNSKRKTIRHVGYRNVELSLAMVQSFFGSPERAVLVGCSAGGIGAYFHLENFRKVFSESRRYVVSDAGLPFKPPQVSGTTYDKIFKNWGIHKHLTHADLGQLIRANTRNFPDTRFGFISSYKDPVMTFFAVTVGSNSGLKVVHETVIDIADNSIGRNTSHAKVYFTDKASHCHTPEDLSKITSKGVSLNRWLSEMVNDQPWQNVRPDLVRKPKLMASIDMDAPIAQTFPEYQ